MTEPLPDLLLNRAWAEVVPGYRSRKRDAACAPYTHLTTGGGLRRVREWVYRGECKGDIALEYARVHTDTGEVRRGSGTAAQLAEYGSFLWLEDARFECFPWPALLSWWSDVVRGGPGWQNEFGVRVVRPEGSLWESRSVLIPIPVARSAVQSRLGFSMLPGDAKAPLEVLRANWRTWDPEEA